MDIKEAIESLKNSIYKVYSETSGKIRPNIVRGHLRSISTDIEDAIGAFVSDLLPEDYSILLDPSIHVDGINNRPDLLIVDSLKNVKAMVEIESNMGWCRDAHWVLDDIVANDKKFKEKHELDCEFSRQETIKVKYEDDVSLFLISLTDGNCPEKKHEANKAYALEHGIKHYLLFSGWYGELNDKEINEFASSIKAL